MKVEELLQVWACGRQKTENADTVQCLNKIVFM